MTLRFCIIFAASLVLGFVAVGSCLEQVSPVTPAPDDGTFDPDYWETDDFVQLPTAYDKFDWTLTKSVAEAVPSERNLLLFPLGLQLALSTLTEAATGVTLAELNSVLGFDLGKNQTRKKFSNIIQSLQTESHNYILNLGSRIYVGDNEQFYQRLVAIAQIFYNTGLETVNFKDPSVAAKKINNWVSDITQGRIPGSVDQDAVTAMVVLILNTVYFKGNWRHQFNPNSTKIGTFYVSAKAQKIVPFMKTFNKFYYAASAKFDAKILRMPYLGNKYSMYIIVPNSLAGLPRVLDNLSDLRQELNNLHEHHVDVTLPKFNLDYTSQLDGVLKKLGVRQAFEETASFPGLVRSQKFHDKLRVSKVLQRSSIEVNEIGSGPYTPEYAINLCETVDAVTEVVVNRPFLFFIQYEATRQLLFTGRISDPTVTTGSVEY